MSNYKWVRLDSGVTELRREDFSSIPSFKVSDLDSFLVKKLEENGVDLSLDGLFNNYVYVLSFSVANRVTITAPLYEFDLKSGQFALISEAYTDETTDPTQYDLVKEIYHRCEEEVAKEQAETFEKLFKENSLDNGISSIISISSNPYMEDCFFGKYVPETYIEVCKRNIPSYKNCCNSIFIRRMDAKRQDISIKVNNWYKGLVIGKNGENIKRIAQLINAKKVNVI